jgi:hypothetical protein
MTPMSSDRPAIDGSACGQAALGTYFHQLLFARRMGAGAPLRAVAAPSWRANTDRTITDLLAIRLLWEEALFAQHERPSPTNGRRRAGASRSACRPDRGRRSSTRSCRRQPNAPPSESWRRRSTAPRLRPATTAPRCRRPFASTCARKSSAARSNPSIPSIRTLGFAGFFGVFAKHRRFASDVEELRLPVLLNPTVTSSSGGERSG